MPGYVGPAAWSGWVAYSLLVANPAMVYAGYILGGSQVTLPLSLIRTVLIASTSTCIVGAVVMGLSMEPSHRHTFWRHRSFRTLMDETWDSRLWSFMPDESCVEGLDPSRAQLLGFASDYWVTSDKLRAHLASWDTWEAERPAWFTDEVLDFQARIIKYAPVEALPRPVLLKILTEAQDDRAEPEFDANVLGTATLISMVKQHRHDTSTGRHAQHFAHALLAIRLYVIAIVISYADLIGDVAVTMTLLQSGEPSTQSAGYVTMGLTVFAQVIQAFISMAMGQGEAAAVAALLGVKPLLDTYNVLADSPLTRGTASQLENAFVMVRKGRTPAPSSFIVSFAQPPITTPLRRHAFKKSCCNRSPRASSSASCSCRWRRRAKPRRGSSGRRSEAPHSRSRSSWRRPSEASTRAKINGKYTLTHAQPQAQAQPRTLTLEARRPTPKSTPTPKPLQDGPTPDPWYNTRQHGPRLFGLPRHFLLHQRHGGLQVGSDRLPEHGVGGRCSRLADGRVHSDPGAPACGRRIVALPSTQSRRDWSKRDHTLHHLPRQRCRAVSVSEGVRDVTFASHWAHP